LKKYKEALLGQASTEVFSRKYLHLIWTDHHQELTK
jgi:hypothetical protein